MFYSINDLITILMYEIQKKKNEKKSKTKIEKK